MSAATNLLPAVTDRDNPFKYSISIQNFPQDGAAWRIGWFGSVEYANRGHMGKQPSVGVNLWRISANDVLTNTDLLLDPGLADRNNNSARAYRRVAIGLLPFLEIGAIWCNGRLLLEPDYQTETFKNLQIKESSIRTIKAGYSERDNFFIPFDEHPWHHGCTHSCCALVSIDSRRRLIIPCIELVRFYFGTSSSLVKKVLMPPLSRGSLFSKPHYNSQTGHLHINLAEDIDGRAADAIGRLCLDPIAWKAAVSVGTSMLDASSRCVPVHPEAIFPFEGATDLTLSGKWVSYGGAPNATFVVFKILSCSAEFPFASLSYTLQLSKKSGLHETSGSQETAYIAAADKSDKTLVERDPSSNLARITRTVKVENRFTDLNDKPVWKKGETQSIGMGSIVHTKNPSSITDAADGESASSQPIRPIDLSIDNRMIQSLGELMAQIIQHLNRIEGISIRLATSGKDGISVPIRAKNAKNEDEPRLFVELDGGDRRPRRMSVLRINQETGGIYLAVIEDDPGRAFFIEAPETKEKEAFRRAVETYVLWRSGWEEFDPFGFHSALHLMGDALEPLVDFLQHALSK